MNKKLFYIITTILSVSILALCGYFINKFNLFPSLATSLFLCFALIIGFLTLLNKPLRTQIIHICSDYDWAEETAKAYNNIPQLYKSSFWWLLGLINLAFLFHTINFMWGGFDWAAVRTAVDTKESFENGNFSIYFLQNLIFEGKILPVINNVIAFGFLSYALVLLAKYWEIPQNKASYIIFGLLLAITPYTLSWLYHVRYTLGVLALPALVMTSCFLSNNDKTSHIKKIINNSLAIILLVIAFGAYMPIISFYSIILLSKILFDAVFKDITLKTAINIELQAIVNLVTALLIYLFLMLVFSQTGFISKTIIFSPNPYQLLDFIKGIFTQFTNTSPFIDTTYKIFYLIITLLGLFTIILKAPSSRAALRGLGIIALILVFTKLPVLWQRNTLSEISTDFFSITIVWALMFAILLKFGGEYLKRIAYALATLIIIMSYVRTSYALKVWKFGFDTEQKLAERIITRMERLPEFNIDKKYKLLQIGTQSLRHKFYLKKEGETENKELIEYAYYNEGHVKDAYNFFYQTDFIKEDADKNEAFAKPEIRDYLLYKARAYPAPEGIAIIDDYIIFIVDDIALNKTQQQLR